MESSWSYDSGDKGFMLSNETVSVSDLPNSRSKTGFMNWGLKGSSYNYDHNPIFNICSPLDNNQGSLEVGFTDMVRKQSFHDSMRNCLSSNASGGGDVINMLRIASNAVSGDEESSSRLSHSVVDSSCKDSSFIDLKLGRFGDNLNYNAPVVMSCAESSTPAKRVKASTLNSQSPVCQVYGCRKDLSSSKDYHKRHKVCDVHSKTAKVIVNDLEQRFCQQCSRFHLLGEFDDGKRSCRRRLAGHNERRRKPQVGLHSAKAGRLFHSYHGFGGARPNGTTMTATSFVCQDILPSSTAPSYSENCGLVDSCKNIKLEHGVDFASKLGNSWVDGQFLQKPVCPSYGLIGKQCPYSDGLNTSIMTANVFNENSFNEYNPQDNVSCSMFQNSLFDTASTVQGFPELSTKSGCALSLLSSQPQSSTGHHHHHSAAISTLIMPGNGSHHNFDMSAVPEDPFGVGSLDLCNGVSSKYPLYRVPSPVGRNQLNSGALANENATNIGSAFGGAFLDGSEYVNVKGGPSYDDGATIDLLQLSTQLQRVEHQRQAVSVKQEDDTFCCLKIT